MDKKEILICECHSTEHQFVFLYSEKNGYPTCYVHTHLVKRPFWERFKYGIKYIFGHKSRLGAFDEFIINPGDAYKLEELVTYLRTGQKVDNWDEVWSIFTKTKEYETSHGMNLYVVFLSWLKKNYKYPIKLS